MDDPREGKFVLWFNEIGKADVHLVGGKNANLGEMFQNLTNAESKLFRAKKFRFLTGLRLRPAAYAYFIKENALDEKIQEILAGLDTHDIKQLEVKGQKSAD